MKELFQCEKCRAIFTTWAEARDHEDHAHSYVPRYGWYDLEAEDSFNENKEDSDKLSEVPRVCVWDPVYDEKHVAPVNITIGLERWVPTDKERPDLYRPRIVLYRYHLCKGTENESEGASVK